jgi:hypothetical protein
VRAGLITTDGFRDLLEMGRQHRPELYNLQADKPPVLVTRDLRFELPERVRHGGRVETQLDETALREAVRALRDAGVEAVAVCFLHSFVRSKGDMYGYDPETGKVLGALVRMNPKTGAIPGDVPQQLRDVVP